MIPSRLLESEFLGRSGVLFKGNPAAARYQSHHHHKHCKELRGKELHSNTSTQVSLILFSSRQTPDYSHLPTVPLLGSYPAVLQKVKVAALSQSHSIQNVQNSPQSREEQQWHWGPFRSWQGPSVFFPSIKGVTFRDYSFNQPQNDQEGCSGHNTCLRHQVYWFG